MCVEYGINGDFANVCCKDFLNIVKTLVSSMAIGHIVQTNNVTSRSIYNFVED